MSKQLKVILTILVGLFIIIQLFPANRPDNNPPPDYDFFKTHQVPTDVEKLVRTACYDCHSQEVNYPWYAYVAPVSWLVSRDVRFGRRNLDFSNWEKMTKKDQIVVAEEIGEEVELESMPMPIYGFMHHEARLDASQRERIVKWSEDLAEYIFNK